MGQIWDKLKGTDIPYGTLGGHLTKMRERGLVGFHNRPVGNRNRYTYYLLKNGTN